ncbi:hypothetical protein AOLI_G00213820 [Acnodon oligacanthus]
MTSNGQKDLNDPAMKTAILSLNSLEHVKEGLQAQKPLIYLITSTRWTLIAYNVIEKKLREEGAGNGTTLRWREKNGKVFHLCKKKMTDNDNRLMSNLYWEQPKVYDLKYEHQSTVQCLPLLVYLCVS